MGCSGSKDSEKPHLVIVGFQYAGYNLLQQVKNKFRVTVIDMKECFEWKTASPSHIFQDGHFEDKIAEYDGSINSKKVFGKNAEFIQGMVSELVNENTLKYIPTKGLSPGSPKGAGEKELSFDYLAICTGSTWNVNDESEEAHNIFQTKDKSAFYKKYRDQLDKAEAILVVGGGPTGVETAAEVIINYPDKEIGIWTLGKRLLPMYGAEASSSAKKYLEKDDWVFYFETKYPNKELDSEFDFVIHCTGPKVHTPFMSTHFGDFKNEDDQIFVNEYYQITNKDPLTGKAKGPEMVVDNIFALGDWSISRLNEPKNIPAAVTSALNVSHNLLKSLHGDKSGFKKVPEKNLFRSGAYFSDKHGVFVEGDEVEIKPNMYKEKQLIEAPYLNFLNSRPDGRQKYKDYIKNLTK